jgi:hypothetical protein
MKLLSTSNEGKSFYFFSLEATKGERKEGVGGVFETKMCCTINTSPLLQELPLTLSIIAPSSHNTIAVISSFMDVTILL